MMIWCHAGRSTDKMLLERFRGLVVLVFVVFSVVMAQEDSTDESGSLSIAMTAPVKRSLQLVCKLDASMPCRLLWSEFSEQGTDFLQTIAAVSAIKMLQFVPHTYIRSQNKIRAWCHATVIM